MNTINYKDLQDVSGGIDPCYWSGFAAAGTVAAIATGNLYAAFYAGNAAILLGMACADEK